jgi:hypothetical protein
VSPRPETADQQRWPTSGTPQGPADPLGDHGRRHPRVQRQLLADLRLDRRPRSTPQACGCTSAPRRKRSQRAPFSGNARFPQDRLDHSRASRRHLVRAIDHPPGRAMNSPWVTMNTPSGSSAHALLPRVRDRRQLGFIGPPVRGSHRPRRDRSRPAPRETPPDVGITLVNKPRQGGIRGSPGVGQRAGAGHSWVLPQGLARVRRRFGWARLRCPLRW